MNWFYLAIFSVISISIANLIQKVLASDEESDPYSYTIVFTLLAAIMTGIFAFFKGFNLPPIGEYPLNFLASSIFYGFGTVLGFKALKTLGASDNVLLTPFGSIVTIISAVIFLNERFGYLRILGAILIFIPIFLLNRSRANFKFKPGTLYALASAALFGLAVTNDAFILKRYDAISYTPVIFILPCIILIILKPSSLKRVGKFLQIKPLLNILLFTFFYSLQAVSYYLALERGAGASQMSVIFKSEIITTVLLATIFLKERKNISLKFIGALLVTVGILLLR